MKTIYLSCEKNGKELIEVFTTLDRANAHQYVGRFYLGSVETETVSNEAFEGMERVEKNCDKGANDYGEMTDLQIYLEATKQC